MKTVFLNPFLPTDLNEKVTSVSFKIGSFDYIAKHANVKTTEKAHLDDIAMAHLSFLFTHWWDDSTFDWEYNTDYPKSFKVGSVIYRVYNMTEVSYQSTQGGGTIWCF